MRLLWVTDFDYPARGREYGAEDRWLIAELGEEFEIVTCDPRDAWRQVDERRLTVVRNSGPVSGYADEYARFRAVALERGAPVYNQLTGRGDMLGKQYLIDLFAGGHPVIPTAHAAQALLLPPVDRYLAKPLHGADSVGLELLTRQQLSRIDADGMLVQPWIDMSYEVSFVFVDSDFQYAVATQPGLERWQLRPYEPSEDDVRFARSFIGWNDIDHGIQRVDACRTADGALLLVELEDLNPYLSLDSIDVATGDRFVTAFAAALRRANGNSPRQQL